MQIKNKVLTLVPARGGSKGVPRKNIRLILGKPLIAYTIEVALQSKFVSEVIVSSDDLEIIEIAKQYGANCPFVRPKELALDSTPMVPVVKHALRFMEKKERKEYEFILLLQPCSPLRIVEDIDGVMQKLIETKADSVITVCKVESHHPILMKRIEGDRILPFCIEEREGTRRQDYRPIAYMRNGAAYAVRRDVLVNKNSLWGEVSRPYIVPQERSISIDSEIDLKLVELLLRERLEKS